MYAMREFDLYIGADCHHCEMLLHNMDQKDFNRCNIINVDEGDNFKSAISNNVTIVPCLIADGRRIAGMSAVLDYLKTH